MVIDDQFFLLYDANVNRGFELYHADEVDRN